MTENKHHSREKIKSYLCVGAFVASIIIGFWGMFLPPLGIIDSSVLIYTAQLLLFTASILGINLSFAGHGSSTHQQQDKLED